MVICIRSTKARVFRRPSRYGPKLQYGRPSTIQGGNRLCVASSFSQPQSKPEERFKKHNLLLCGIIPGPNNPRDIHSFLRPIVDELKALATGIENVYDSDA